jgi:hypothetical protein
MCGMIGADVRPNWCERPLPESLTGTQWRRPPSSVMNGGARHNGPSRNGIHFCKRPAASRHNAPSQKSIIVNIAGGAP